MQRLSSARNVSSLNQKLTTMLQCCLSSSSSSSSTPPGGNGNKNNKSSTGTKEMDRNTNRYSNDTTTTHAIFNEPTNQLLSDDHLGALYGSGGSDESHFMGGSSGQQPSPQQGFARSNLDTMMGNLKGLAAAHTPQRPSQQSASRNPTTLRHEKESVAQSRLRHHQSDVSLEEEDPMTAIMLGYTGGAAAAASMGQHHHHHNTTLSPQEQKEKTKDANATLSKQGDAVSRAPLASEDRQRQQRSIDDDADEEAAEAAPPRARASFRDGFNLFRPSSASSIGKGGFSSSPARAQHQQQQQSVEGPAASSTRASLHPLQQGHILKPDVASTSPQQQRSRFREMEDDDDDEYSANNNNNNEAASLPKNAVQDTPAATEMSLEELTSLAAECTMLDDTNFAYFQPVLPSHGHLFPKDVQEYFARPALAEESYVPGQPVVPPGFTRYRCDVQFQGDDFDGWDKSMEKLRHRSALEALSKQQQQQQSSSPVLNASERYQQHASAVVSDLEFIGVKPRARRVLEDALAAALDLSEVKVFASVQPESGAHVRRLVCHVDIPSTVQMQPRTVLQRATMWLEKKASAQKRAPLAILSFFPVPAPFDARASALRRVYVYRILNRVAPPLFDAGFQWHVDQYLDVDRMNRFASLYFQGTHDFGAFVDPKLGHALRKSLDISRAVDRNGNSNGTSQQQQQMAFFSPAASKAEREVQQLVAAGRRQTRDKVLSARVSGYVGEDLRAETAGTSSEAGMALFDHFNRDPHQQTDNEGHYTHQRKKEEFKEWNPYDEQDPYNLRKMAEAREASFTDYSPVTTRTIERVSVVRQEDEVLIWFVGKSFLRHQMRNMVSVLKAAGQGLWDERELKAFMEKGFNPQRAAQRDRLPIAPIQGLTLWDVEYESVHQSAAPKYVDSGRTITRPPAAATGTAGTLYDESMPAYDAIPNSAKLSSW